MSSKKEVYVLTNPVWTERGHVKDVMKRKIGVGDKMAGRHGNNVIPMAISGTADILENNRRFQVKPTTVHITFGQPIYPDQLERAEKKHLGATIREEIIEMRKKHKTS